MTTNLQELEILCFRCQLSCFKRSTLLGDTSRATELHVCLRANSLPPDESIFRRLVDTAAEEVARYDSEIASFQILLDQIISERAAIAVYADECQSLFSPIRRLPSELLAEIFEYCPPPDEQYSITYDSTPEMELNRLSQRHLLRLSQVCHLWYKIVMGTSKLWSTIIVDPTLWLDTDVSSSTLLSLLECSLTRSGTYPLRIEFASQEFNPMSATVLQTLCQHSTRWIDAHLLLDGPDSLLSFDGVQGNLERLETLSIYNIPEDVRAFVQAPRLRSVSFGGHPVEVPDLPWDQLATFEYMSHSAAYVSSALLLALRLRPDGEFIFAVDVTTEPWLDVGAPVSLAISLLTLSLGLSSAPAEASNVFGRILDSLLLLNLKEFMVFPRHDAPVVWNTDRFSALAQRSGFNQHLTCIEIFAIITEQELLQCLALLPQLEKLCLTDFSVTAKHILITNSLLRALSVRPEGDTPHLIPRLSHFRLTTLLEFSDEAYVEFTKSRIPLAKTNGKFQLSVRWLPGSQRTLGTLDELDEYVARGEVTVERAPQIPEWHL